MPIIITNNQPMDLPLNEADLISTGETTLKRHQAAASVVGIGFITSDYMQFLNETYRDKNHPTNTLSFPYNCTLVGQLFLGDIYMAPQVLAQESPKAQLGSYYRRILIHSILHLLGYDHQTPESAKIMVKAEEQAQQACILNS